MPEPAYTIITTRAVRDRYLRTLKELSRQRNEAAYEWTRLHWWQWRKRRRLWRNGLGFRVLDSNWSSLDNPDR